VSVKLVNGVGVAPSSQGMAADSNPAAAVPSQAALHSFCLDVIPISRRIDLDACAAAPAVQSPLADRRLIFT
jgi:hypothetical protein